MGNRVKWIEHGGKRILFCDYSNIHDEEEFVGAIVEAETEVLKQAPGTLILMLIDATGSHLTAKVIERANKLAAAARRKEIPSSPTAVVGLSSFVQKAILAPMQFLRPDLHAAESIAAAKDWLVEKPGRSV